VLGAQVEPLCDTDGVRIVLRITARDEKTSVDGSTAALGIPDVEIERDYDGVFAVIVRDLVTQKVTAGEKFMHKKIIVSAGPFRSYDIRWHSVGDCLNVDFYSVCRYHRDQDFAEALMGLMGVL
jgi:hypothetical protein